MTFSAKTLKMLWGRAAARCSMPDCRIHLVEDASLTDDEALIGENCHIVGSSSDGPRGKVDLAADRRDLYGNLILLCRNHHRLIDQKDNEYSVDVLHEIKRNHEAWVLEKLQPNEDLQREEEAYAGIVDGWAARSRLDNWEVWTSHVLGSGQPQLAVSVENDLENLQGWLLKRHWSGVLPNLENAFLNFRIVLGDFLKTFHEHSERRGEIYRTLKFYKTIWHRDPADYDRLAVEYDKHVDLVTDLCFELTRAANRIVEVVRRELIKSYREDEGKVSVVRGPNQNLGWDTYIPEYRGDLATDPVPYQGVENLLTNLAKRDFWFSSPPENGSGSEKA